MLSFMKYTLLATLYLLRLTQSKAVFAHYMLGDVTADHAHQDIDNAIAMGLDGFALNIGDPTQDYVGTTLSNLFGYAALKPFKLFISMDVAACACDGPDVYDDILHEYLVNEAYFLGPNGLPMISTFSSGGFSSDDWSDWKSSFANDMYFIPMLDDTDGYYETASGWWSYWGDLIEGLFSWEPAWPYVGETNAGDISQDLAVQKAADYYKKGYMMALSPLQYKDAYGANIYRLGDLNLPKRMSAILGMSPAPDFLEIITWNDGPESHYIGSVWPEANTDPTATLYSNQTSWSHTAWQPLLTSFIDAYKNGKSSFEMISPGNAVAVGALWYKTILQSATCPGAQQPQGWDTGTDTLNWAIVLPEGSKITQARGVSDGKVLQTVDVGAGLSWGSFEGVMAGDQRLELLDKGGSVVQSASGGLCVDGGCRGGIYNMNVQVVGLVEGAGEAGTCD